MRAQSEGRENMITLRTFIALAIIATSFSFMSAQATAETNFDSVLVRQPQTTSTANRKIYIDNGSVKVKFSDGSLSWQVSILHADTGVVTNNIEIELIDKEGFVMETLYSICMESKPFSLTLFRKINTFHSDVKEIKTLVVKTKSMGKNFCNGYGVDKGELQIGSEDIVEWIRTASLSEYVTLTPSN